MEIQQKEKKSLTAYIHHFKREAKDVTLQIVPPQLEYFVKGLRNAQMLAAQVYEKGPQTLADAISKVNTPGCTTVNSNSNTTINS